MEACLIAALARLSAKCAASRTSVENLFAVCMIAPVPAYTMYECTADVLEATDYNLDEANRSRADLGQLACSACGDPAPACYTHLRRPRPF
mmetsp:Transcript_55186/g.156448  ORF Transcript_55186/g.156448 Transcript_55186/m.156448 type:complete len:91 (-) Transcript_55186:8-280(-)